MTKKYRLEMPEMIRSEHAWIACVLEDTIEIEEGHNYSNKKGKVHFSDIPKDWLKEIKQPMTFDDIIKHIGNMNPRVSIKALYTKDEMEECHKMTIENERLKHEPKLVLDELVEKVLGISRDSEYVSVSKDDFAAFIKEWDKNRGYNED